jgi:hypothetical protein
MYIVKYCKIDGEFRRIDHGILFLWPFEMFIAGTGKRRKAVYDLRLSRW